MQNIKERVFKVVYDKAVVKGNAEEELLINMGIDSLKKVELIISLEEEFDVQFNDSDLDPSKINTIGDITAIVNKYVIIS